jgi:hypothetical protein
MICEVHESAFTSSAFKTSSVSGQGNPRMLTGAASLDKTQNADFVLQRGYYKDYVLQCILRVGDSSQFPILVPWRLAVDFWIKHSCFHQEGAIICRVRWEPYFVNLERSYFSYPLGRYPIASSISSFIARYTGSKK